MRSKTPYLGPLGVFIFLIVTSCNNKNQDSTGGSILPVQDSVRTMMGSIAKDISKGGPIAWLNYFENSPEFFMASGGHLAFSNHETASAFIKDTLVKNISKIALDWNNIRIDSLSPTLAGIGAGFHEELTGSDNKKMDVDGYFTAIAHHETEGWKLRNAHWSMLTTK